MIFLTNKNSIESNVYYSDNISLKSSSYVAYDRDYDKTILNYGDKLKLVLKEYNLTENMYKVVAGIVASESKANSYNESYAVFNTIFNRTKSNRWVKHVNNIYGEGSGNNIYYQSIAPNQFTVYSSGSYKKYINNVPKAVNEAIIDLLYTKKPLHNYLSFRSSSYKGANTVQFETGGNKYFNELT